MFRPTNGRVLVRPDAAEEKTSFGLLLVDSQKEKPVTGVVVVGNDVAKKGSRVLFSRYGFDELTLDKVIYYVVSSESILGTF